MSYNQRQALKAYGWIFGSIILVSIWPIALVLLVFYLLWKIFK